MAKKKMQLEGSEVVETKWFTINRTGLCLILVLAIIVGVFTVLIFNVGYDGKNWYWKPNNLEVKLKKEGSK